MLAPPRGLITAGGGFPIAGMPGASRLYRATRCGRFRRCMKHKSRAVEQRDADKQGFLKVLAERGTVCAACAAIGRGRTTVYSWRETDEEFANAWDDIVETTTDEIERTLVELALKGYNEVETITDPSGGITEKVRRRMDPGSLRFLLGSRRREVYGERRQVEHRGDVTVKRVVFESEEPEPEEADL